MRVLVLSDSHGHAVRLRKVLQKEADCAAVCFLGDGLSDLEKAAEDCKERKIVAVRGNNDWNSEYTAYDDFAYQYFEGHTVVLTHGHRIRVNVSLQDLALKAHSVLADVALYGHTHRQNCQTISGVLMVNPGALCDGDYAVLTFSARGVDVSFRHLGEQGGTV